MQKPIKIFIAIIVLVFVLFFLFDALRNLEHCIKFLPSFLSPIACEKFTLEEAGRYEWPVADIVGKYKCRGAWSSYKCPRGGYTCQYSMVVMDIEGVCVDKTTTLTPRPDYPFLYRFNNNL